MRATVYSLSAGMVLLALTTTLQAQIISFSGIPPAPDACGPGFYYYQPHCGCPGASCAFGPYYCVRPPWDPFNGAIPSNPTQARQGYGPSQGPVPPGAPMAPGGAPMAPRAPGAPMAPSQFAMQQAIGHRPQGGPGGQLAFPTHPFARSPRDFFMEEVRNR